MIRAVYQDGVIRPLEDVPPEWSNGQELRVIPAEVEPPADPEGLERWFQELTELGPAQYDPGEREQIQSLLDEADAQAKALVRQEMGLS